MDSLLDLRRQRRRIRLRPYLKCHQGGASKVLFIRKVEEWLRLAGEELKLGVARNPHYFHIAVFPASQVEGAAQGVLAGPEVFRCALADDGHMSAVIVVRGSKGAAAQNAD